MKITKNFGELARGDPKPGTETDAASTKTPFLDSSLLGITLGNVLSIVLAAVFDWDLLEVLWIYWGQSVVIGLSNFVRILGLREFSTAGFSMYGRPAPESRKTKRHSAGSFLVHYGFFHFIYAFFLTSAKPLKLFAPDDLIYMLVALGGFALSHGYSLLHNKADDFRHRKPDLGTLVFYPYLRILPMHLVMGGGLIAGASAISIFMIMKTFTDVGMHMAEHALFRRA
ncbi:MAG: DUF6498-containing protein [Candidatus Hydrogenedentota bacterium]